ncbi:hypothetical protein BH10PSE7_BH10PSE7_25070 [soil metagenome]
MDIREGRTVAPDTYRQQLDGFLERHAASRAVPAIFHAVRNLAYASDGSRSPEAAMRTGKGACTAKHILLRDLLRHVGEEADIELVEGDFAAALPLHGSMSDDLKRWIRSGGITDFHCYVVWHHDGGDVTLDATWPDALIPFGFAVNRNWDGASDTRIALEPIAVRSRTDDVIAQKEMLLATLMVQQRKDRRSFLELLTAWMPGMT